MSTNPDQSTLRAEVAEIRSADLVWPFTAGRSEYPNFRPRESYSPVELDPFPCYAHDVGEVRLALALCEAAVPPQTWLKYYVSHFEGSARTNGFADRRHDYSGGEDSPADWWGMVFLSGKRIPPHPAVSRYVTGHEYGHHVQWWLDRARGFTGGDTVLEGYAELRDLDPHAPYGGGHWHRVPGEVFACDFRVLVAKIEPEFWPHPGVRPPATAPGVRAWWREAVADLRHYAATRAQEAEDAA